MFGSAKREISNTVHSSRVSISLDCSLSTGEAPGIWGQWQLTTGNRLFSFMGWNELRPASENSREECERHRSWRQLGLCRDSCTLERKSTKASEESLFSLSMNPSGPCMLVGFWSLGPWDKENRGHRLFLSLQSRYNPITNYLNITTNRIWYWPLQKTTAKPRNDRDVPTKKG